MLSFLPFPDIELFHNIVKAVAAYPHLATGPITYRGKIKLHGTNASVRIENGEIAAQSRTQIITPENDNNSFAKWVESRREYFLSCPLNCNRDKDGYTVFGEWCGKGIQKGTAISQIPNKILAVFAIMWGDTENALMIIDPVEIEKHLPNRPSDIHILPWYGEAFTVDLKNRDTLPDIVDKLNKIVAEVEPNDPWVKQVFGVDGTAEGVVYYPTGTIGVPGIDIDNNGNGALNMILQKSFSDLAFKAKGEKHKVVKTKTAVQLDPEVAHSIDEFVKMFATEARFEQGLAAIGGSTEMKNIPNFLKWFSSDIFKESADELEVSGLKWSQVEKSISAAARNWFIVKNRTITA